MRRRSVILASISLGVAGSFVVLLLGFWSLFRAEGPSLSEIRVVIPQGSGLGAIADRLHEAGVLDTPWVFRFGTLLSGDSRLLGAGEYAFPANVSPKDVLAILKAGKGVERALTFPEGISLGQALAILEQARGLKGPVFPLPDEGSLLPETYFYHWGETKNALVKRMQKAMQALLEDLWPQRATDLPLQTPQQALILASIVEKETAKPDERARVAAVFINRLNRKMKLQSDPTVIYALTKGNPLGRALTRRDLTVDSPYNTYRYPDLPPAPICLPGAASLKAVLHPADTSDLYFVSDGAGGHRFARTLAEHNRNVARWRKTRASDPAPPDTSDLEQTGLE